MAIDWNNAYGVSNGFVFSFLVKRNKQGFLFSDSSFFPLRIPL